MSPSIDGPRLIEPDEFDETMELVNRCFGYDLGGLEARMPHCFDEVCPEHHAIIRSDGDIVSHVVCVPATLVAGDASVECHGIAGVATSPDHRGNGYMSQLIEFWLSRLEERGVPLAELEGDRVRYGRFGWENAGRESRYRITRRSFDAAAGATADVRSFDDTDLDTIREVHEAERYRIRRNRRRYEQLLHQTGLETLIYDGDETAYLCYRGTDPASVLEFGGSGTGVTSLIGRLLEKANDVVVSSHPRHPLTPHLRDIAASWERSPHRKLNLLDLATTIEAYQPLLGDRWSQFSEAVGESRGAITLAVDDTAADPSDLDPDSVTITYGPDGVNVERTGRDPDVSLDRREMVELLFGSPDTCRPSIRSQPFLKAVLPLEYYFWQTETI